MNTPRLGTKAYGKFRVQQDIYIDNLIVDVADVNGFTPLGNWDADTNTPALTDSPSVKAGSFYEVSTAGSSLISGEDDWKKFDWIMSTGTTWSKMDRTDAVTSVGGNQGNISLADLNLDNVNNIGDSEKEVSTPQQNALNAKADATATTNALAEKLVKTQNLSDLPNKATSRSNLGLGNTATARSNLGLKDLAVKEEGTGGAQFRDNQANDNRFCLEDNNLSDLTNKTTARSNLGLKSMATRETGTGSSQHRTNSQMDGRYLRGIRLGSQGYKYSNSDVGYHKWYQLANGQMFQGWLMQFGYVDDFFGGVRYRPLQYNLNGSWVTVGV